MLITELVNFLIALKSDKISSRHLLVVYYESVNLIGSLIAIGCFVPTLYDANWSGSHKLSNSPKPFTSVM